ncbi:hypothetical protein Q8A67_022144 [Cirrhinus molitorella]|uniref:Uncharacterized protein n=1 Tax=Cirrhinus molitorella TaxID=172907 RepID=A0AA88P858_9TELE|nr:hypothetical protein Q8A67_022144 [Cirrhinus molitorella]
MNSGEKVSKSKESWEKGLLKHVRRESIHHKPNMCLDSGRHEEFPLGESETVTDEITSVRPACSLLSSSAPFFIFICHSAVSNVTVCHPLLDTLVQHKSKKFTQKLKLSLFVQPYVAPV